MTEQHPITPPPELRRLWAQQAQRLDPYDPAAWMEHVSTQAARWGADQQLDQDAKWLDTNAPFSHNLTITPSGGALRQVMRPKPPSLKEQALAVLDDADGADHPVVATVLTADQHALIRRALESLPD